MKEVFASLYNDRAISYRVHKGFAHADVALSAGVQRMVRSDLGAAGVMFTIDTESGFEDVVFITSSYGLGETVVQGAVNPDEYYVFKPTLKTGFKPILQKRVDDGLAVSYYLSVPGFGGGTFNTGTGGLNLVPWNKRDKTSNQVAAELTRETASITGGYVALAAALIGAIAKPV